MRKHYDIPETWHIFPLANNAKIPEKGSAGFKDALPRDEALKKWLNITSGNAGLYPSHFTVSGGPIFDRGRYRTGCDNVQVRLTRPKLGLVSTATSSIQWPAVVSIFRI